MIKPTQHLGGTHKCNASTRNRSDTWAQIVFPRALPHDTLTELSHSRKITFSWDRQQTQRLVPSNFRWQLWLILLIRPSARHGLKVISDRHMRSKRRCSCVLQFTLLHAVSCVLHRPTSRVIHHSRLIFNFFIFLYFWFFNRFSWELYLSHLSERQVFQHDKTER